MTLGAAFSTLAALAMVIGLLLVVARLAARFGGGAAPLSSPDAALRVVARVGLAPRQGVAVLRVGGRGLVVSVGEAGVHTLAELDAAELASIERAQPAPPQPAEILSALRGGLAGVRGRVADARRRGPLAALFVLPLAFVLASPLHAAAPADSPALRMGSVAALGLDSVATAIADSVALDVDLAAAAQQAPSAARVLPADSVAAALLPAMSVAVGSGDSGLRLTGTVGAVVLLGLLATLPTLLLLTTAFTRILIVLHLLRHALGTQNAPPGHLLAALALLLTGFVMAPTLAEVNRVAVAPWVAGAMDEGTMIREAAVPLRAFMLDNTSERDLITFIELSEMEAPETEADVPMVVLMSAFAISELRAAFQMGFAIFLPFIVIDLVVAAVLTSMGMFMLPPTMIALPCKLMLFVLVDGWGLVVRGLVQSFA